MASESREALREASLAKACLRCMTLEELLNNVMHTKISTALSAQKRASRSSFVNLPGCSMLSTTVTSREMVSIEHEKYENQ